MKYLKLGIFLALLLALGGFFLYQLRQEEKTKRLVIDKTLAEHKQAVYDAYVRIQTSVTNIMNFDKSGKEYMLKAEAAVLAVTGTKFDRETAKKNFSAIPFYDQKYVPEPVEKPQKPDKPAKIDRPEETKLVPPPPPPPTPSPAPVSRPPAAKPAAIEPVQVDEDTPPGEPSRAQLDALRRGRSGEKPPPDQPAPDRKEPGKDVKESPKAPPRATSSKPPPPPPPAKSVSHDAEIVVLARRLYYDSETLGEKASSAQTFITSAGQCLAAANSARMPLESQEFVEKIGREAKMASVLETEAEQILFTMTAKLQSILDVQAKVEKDKELQRQEQIRIEKELAHKKLIAGELASVGELKSKNPELLKQYRYDEIYKALVAKQAELQTEEAKNSLKQDIERFAYLQKLKTFIISTLNSRPFKWGWGAGPSAKDILGATEDVLKITGDRIAWTDVTIPQMIKIIEYCLADTSLDRKVRGEQSLAVALFHQVNGNSELAQRQAREIKEKFPTLKEEVDKILSF